MQKYKKFLKILFIVVPTFISTSIYAEEEEIYLKAISDQIQVITKDLKTLEKAVYQKSDIATTQNIKSTKSDGLNEDLSLIHI